MHNMTSFTSRIEVTAVTCVLSVLALAVYGFIAYSLVPVVNVLAITVTLYAASSLVVGGGPKKLLDVFTISVLFTVVSDLCFVFLQSFVAFCISIFVLLVTVRYSLVGEHDSGWFGAICVAVIGLIFLLPIEMILAMTQYLPFPFPF